MSLDADAAVVAVDSVTKAPESTELVKCWLDCPTGGAIGDSYLLTVAGWVLGRDLPAVAVEIEQEGEVVTRLPVDFPRPDIARAFPRSSFAAHSGFNADIALIGLAQKFELSLHAVLEDEDRHLLWTIRGRRKSLRRNVEHRLQPVLVTTYGRTGSTWLMRLLAEHPGIAAYRPFVFEPRVVSYWAQVMAALAEPASYLRALRPTLDLGDWWLGRDLPPPNFAEKVDADVRGVLGRKAILALADFGQTRVEEFYRTVARAQEKPAPTFFAEKGPSGTRVWHLLHELYPGLREIYLVRDPRDMVCSILSYNERRGVKSFGRESVESDEEFLTTVRDATFAMLRDHRGRGAHMVRYEDVIVEPRRTLGQVLDHIGVDSSGPVVDGILDRADEENVHTASHRTSTDTAASIGRWRRDLDPHLRERANEVFAQLLPELGYEVADTTARPVE